MDTISIITILIAISATFAYLNERFIKLPGTIGVISISVILSLLILIAGKASGGWSGTITTLAHDINFSNVLLNIMLGFLLFAGALHFDYEKLKALRWEILLLSTLGVVVSVGVFGSLFYLAAIVINVNIPIVYCFLFGALISPTDPIAVAAILKNSRVPPRLHTLISGESLFNDAVGLILFVILLEISNPFTTVSALGTLKLIAQEVLGGVLIGLVAGYAGHRLLRAIKDFQTIFLISTALVLCIALIDHKLHASIPLSAVVAGLIIGNKSTDQRNVSNQFLHRIWTLIDEVLNTILLVLIGLQLAIMPFMQNYWLIGSISIVIILIARVVSISLPALVVLQKLSFRNLSILTWAGIRGGISVALALSLPMMPYREIILASCYFIVIFSIVVQGLTLNKVVKIAMKKHKI